MLRAKKVGELCGNQRRAEAIRKWLGGRSEAQAKHAAARQGGRAGSDSDSYDSDEGCESLDEDDDAIELRNIIVLEGPCAGKTAAALRARLNWASR